jgi:hypothetical protein
MIEIVSLTLPQMLDDYSVSVKVTRNRHPCHIDPLISKITSDSLFLQLVGNVKILQGQNDLGITRCYT